jgi:hypothetical protein
VPIEHDVDIPIEDKEFLKHALVIMATRNKFRNKLTDSSIPDNSNCH